MSLPGPWSIILVVVCFRIESEVLMYAPSLRVLDTRIYGIAHCQWCVCWSRVLSQTERQALLIMGVCVPHSMWKNDSQLHSVHSLLAYIVMLVCIACIYTYLPRL